MQHRVGELYCLKIMYTYFITEIASSIAYFRPPNFLYNNLKKGHTLMIYTQV